MLRLLEGLNAACKVLFHHPACGARISIQTLSKKHKLFMIKLEPTQVIAFDVEVCLQFSLEFLMCKTQGSWG